MRHFPPSTGNVVLFAVLAGALATVHYGVARHESTALLVCYAVAFGSFIFLQKQPLTWQQIFWAGVLLRLMLFLGIPTLSDDFYRFIWDGKLLSQGISPYAHLPYWHVENTPDMYFSLFEKLNSPEYFTVYPPLSQTIFFISVYFGKSLEGAVLILRLVILLAEVATFFVFKKLLHEANDHPNQLAIYFLNPLVILELTGNLHFEGIMLLFLLLTLYFFKRNQPATTGIMLGLGVATKLLPLMALPAIIFRIHWKKSLLLLTALLFTIVLSFYPFFDQNLFQGMSESLDLFVRKFEFNGSLYYLYRAFGFWKKGYNMIATIGPLMILISGVMILGYSYWKRKEAIAAVLVDIWMIYLAFALVVHPWYIIPMLGLSVITQRKYPLVWSGLIFITYAGYAATGYEHQWWLIVAEYLVLYSYILVEIFYHKKTTHA